MNNRKSKIVFMGSPEFAVPALRRLVSDGYRVEVVTQPDRPAGRGGQPAAPAVKRAALELGLDVFQPETLRDAAVVERLRAMDPAVIVVVAYGEILRRAVLELPLHGCVNIHPSLLPRWRGPVPMPAAIAAGDKVSGVSIIQMDAGMDSGPLLAQEEAPIEPHDTGATLAARLSEFGADLLSRTLPKYLSGEITPQPQATEGVTICKLLTREDGLLDWTRPAIELARQVRAYDPWPGTYTFWRGKRLKVLAASAYDPDVDISADLWANNEPGTVVALADNAGASHLAVRTGAGWLDLERVQLEGKGPTVAAAFLAGYAAFVGARLGE